MGLERRHDARNGLTAVRIEAEVLLAGALTHDQAADRRRDTGNHGSRQ
jgi:hypothetical protein